MSCNCNGCGQPQRLCRCPKGKGEAPKRAYIAECTDCDPCRPCESMVKICSFVTPTLTEGQRFRNSFVYNQEDDSVYYISDDGTPTRFGSSPMFIDNFNPEDKAIPRQVVFDFANNKAYIFNPEGEYIAIDLLPGAKKYILTQVSDGVATLSDDRGATYSDIFNTLTSAIENNASIYYKLDDTGNADKKYLVVSSQSGDSIHLVCVEGALTEYAPAFLDVTVGQDNSVYLRVISLTGASS